MYFAVFRAKMDFRSHFEKDAMTEVSSTIKPTPATTMRKGPRGEVRIYATWCKGCQICVEFCPTNVLAMHPNGNHPIVVAEEKCTACHFCDTHCPDLAILVKKID
jgi:NAD-dependent dihydropyrimidine dehydrogenase PreA subunit